MTKTFLRGYFAFCKKNFVNTNMKIGQNEQTMIVFIGLNLGKDAFSLKNKGVTYTMMGGIGMIR